MLLKLGSFKKTDGGAINLIFHVLCGHRTMFMSPLVAAHKVLALNWKADVASSFSVGRIA